MPLQGRPVSGNFDQAAFNFIHGNEGFVDTPYLDSVGVPTIGYGYALLSRSSNGVYSVSQSGLQADFAGIHTFTIAELNLLQNIATDLTAHNLAGAKALFNNRNAGTLSFTITPAEGVTLFNEKLNRLVDLFIPSDIRTNLAGTYELIALEDMAYNGGGALFGANMLKALRESDPIQSRLDTWYQIVFASNGGGSASVGIENRRLREASEFGLYSNGNQPSQTDKGKEALRVALYLNSKYAQMLAFLKRWYKATTSIAKINGFFSPAETTLLTNGMYVAHPNGAAKLTDSTNISFKGTSLKIYNPGIYTGTISNYGPGDVLDLAGIGTATSVTLDSNNTLSVKEVGGKVLLVHFNPAASFTEDEFLPTPDGSGGTAIRLVAPVGEKPPPGSTVTNPSGAEIVGINYGIWVDGALSLVNDGVILSIDGIAILIIGDGTITNGGTFPGAWRSRSTARGR